MDPTSRPVVLTERQGRVLWLLSTGRTREAIARDTGCALSGVKGVCQRINLALQASNTAHAVRIGLLDGHIGPYENCGSLAAYRRHIKHDEPICAACKRGNRERVAMDALRRTRPTATDQHARLLRAMAAGRSNLQIRQAWGIPGAALDRLISSAYTALGVDHYATPVLRREAALREARLRGLLGVQMPTQPLAPAKRAVHLTDTQVRILAELDAGASIAEAADRLGMNRGTCSSRLSEAYQRLDVSWMDKAVRRDTAIRRAREAGMLPEPVTT